MCFKVEAARETVIWELYSSQMELFLVRKKNKDSIQT